MSPCPDEEVLLSFSSLGGTASEELQAHLDGCDRCRLLLGELMASSSSGTERPQPEQRYEILERLGSGGTGTVYLAEDSTLKRRVALKVLRSRFQAEEGESRALLVREAQALARLSHPNVVQVYDVCTYGDDFFLAMEYVPGRNLTEWMAASPHSARAVLEVFLRAGEGLAAAHAAGLIHQDVKPSNILVGEDGRVRITDFGFATLERLAPATSPEAQAGTPAYLAPERFRGERGDARSDQFSFFVALLEALHGAKPFTGGRFEVPVLAGVPKRVQAAIARGMSLRPEDRFPSMKAALAELSRPWWRPKHLTRAAAVAVGVAAVAGGTFAVRYLRAQSCQQRVRSASTLWSAARKSELSAAFVKAAGPAGAQAYEAVAVAIDAYVEAWEGAERQACSAGEPREGGPQAECLTQRLAELDAVLRRYSAADAALVQEAGGAVQALRFPGACATAGLKAAQPDARAAGLKALRSEILAHEASGRYGAALELLPGSQALARSVGQREDEAELLVAQGRILLLKGEPAHADAPLFAGAALAQELRRDDLATRGWLLLSQRARNLGALEESERAVTLAGSLAARAADVWLPVEVLAERASLAAERGQYDGALEDLRRVLAAIPQLPADDRRARRLRAQYAHALFLGRKLEEALEVDFALLETARRLDGDDHPEVAKLHSRISGVLGALDREEEALEHAVRARDLLASSLGEKSVLMISTLSNIATLHHSLGHLDASLAAGERAVTLAKEVTGAESPLAARLVGNYGYLLLCAGRFAQAASSLEESLALMGRMGRADHADSLRVRTNLGRAQLALGKAKAASEQAARAAAASEQAGFRRELASALVVRGAALLELRQPQQALGVLERAWALRGDVRNEVVKTDIQLNYARALYDTRDRERAAALAAEGVARFKDEPVVPVELRDSLKWAREFEARGI